MAGLKILIGYAVVFGSCSAQHALQISIKDIAGAAVANAVVMLQPEAGVSIASRLPKRNVAVDQIDREFVPKITIASMGEQLSFPNRDVVQHSVYSFSKAKTFEIPIYVGDSPQVLTLDKAGVITLGCNIHDWMVGYVVVTDAPIAEISKADGIINLSDLPRGRYSVKVWHPQQKGGEFNQTMELTEAQQLLNIKLELAPLRVRYKPPLKIKGY